MIPIVVLALLTAARPVIREEAGLLAKGDTYRPGTEKSVSARQLYFRELKELNPDKTQLSCDACVAAQTAAVQAELAEQAAADDLVEALKNLNKASMETRSAMKDETDKMSAYTKNELGSDQGGDQGGAPQVAFTPKIHNATEAARAQLRAALDKVEQEYAQLDAMMKGPVGAGTFGDQYALMTKSVDVLAASAKLGRDNITQYGGDAGGDAAGPNEGSDAYKAYAAAKEQRIAVEKAEEDARAIKDTKQVAEEAAKAASAEAVAKSREACAGFDLPPMIV